MKNKIILLLTCIFSIFFLAFIFKLSDDIQRKEEILASSPNILDVTDKIRTFAYVSSEDLPAAEWAAVATPSETWKEVKIPDYAPIKETQFKEGNFGYYKIFIPKDLMESLEGFRNELEFSPQYVMFSYVEIYRNGSLLRTNTSHTGSGALITVPLEFGVDNVIGIKGKIKTGDTGIKHRGKILLGKSAEIRDLHTASYKGNIVFPLIFLLSKGSVIFVFGLIYLLLNVQKFFEKSLIFSMCAFGEDLLVGDFFASSLTINSRVYIYNVLNILGTIFLFLFLADVAAKKFNRRVVISGSILLAVISAFAAVDILNMNWIFNFNSFLQFWNLVSICVIAFYIPQLIKTDKILVFIMTVTIALSGLSLFSANIGLNYKMLGNLLMFFMVAYQSFALFRREQIKLQEQEVLLIEQEKDVAIGKTASFLAHDVRRPLEQIKLILDKVAQGEVSPEFIRTAKQDVNFSITSVNNQINDIMNYSKASPAQLHELSFYKILSGSIKQVMTINRDVNLELVYDFKAQVNVFGDEGRLASSITNLISNAVEAIRDIGKKNSGTIRFETRVLDRKFMFTIFNDGPLIPESNLCDIWKPSFSSGKVNGTGLGLSSVQKNINDLKGEIKCRNVSSGVEFEITLDSGDKVDKSTDFEFQKESSAYSYQVKPSSENKMRPIRIFLLDDDLHVHDYIKSLVSNLPFHVDLMAVNRFESARDAVLARRFDLYILDNDQAGKDLKEQCLSHLKDEVIIHDRRPMMYEELLARCESVYQKRMRILLVDDGELTLMAWEMFHGKHNIKTATSPEAALELLKQDQTFDLCVVDYYFDNSRMTGEQLAVEMLKIKKEMKVVLASNAGPLVSEFKSIDKNHFDVRNV